MDHDNVTITAAMVTVVMMLMTAGDDDNHFQCLCQYNDDHQEVTDYSNR